MYTDTGLLSLSDPFSDKPVLANSFTPWFRLIARDLLFPWWDDMLAKSRSEGWDPETGKGTVRAGVLEGGLRTGEIIRMV